MRHYQDIGKQNRRIKAQQNRRLACRETELLSSRRSVVRRPRERPPRAVARLVPVPRLISVARPVKYPGRHHSAEHRYAARFATSCAVSWIAAAGPARGRARPLLYRLRSEQRARPSPREPRRALQHGSDAAPSRSFNLAWLWTGRAARGWSFLFSGILRFDRRFRLLRLRRLLRRDRGARCHWPLGVWRHQGARCNPLFRYRPI